MNVEALAADFWRDGYLVLDNVFEHALMDEYQQLIIEHFGETPAFLHNQEFLAKAKTDVIPWFPQQDGLDVFDRVEKNRFLVDLTTAILGGGWSALYCMTMFSGRGTDFQPQSTDLHGTLESGSGRPDRGSTGQPSPRRTDGGRHG